jgi:RNA polymerase sigma-70 factor (ECF subfamily)
MADNDDHVEARLEIQTPVESDDRRRRFEQLAAAVYEPLQRYIRRRGDASIAEDALAETLVVLWRRLDDVPSADPLPWCYGVARRCLANTRRSTRRHDRLVARIAGDPLLTAELVEADAAGDGSTGDDHLTAALAQLSDGDRELVRLWAWEGLEPREIAVTLDSTPNAISIRLHRLRRRLADELTTSRGTAGGKDHEHAGHDDSTRHAPDPSGEDDEEERT